MKSSTVDQVEVSLAEKQKQKIQYVAKIYKMGDNKMVVSIPKKVWAKLEEKKLLDKDLLVTLERIIDED